MWSLKSRQTFYVKRVTDLLVNRVEELNLVGFPGTLDKLRYYLIDGENFVKEG